MEDEYLPADIVILKTSEKNSLIYSYYLFSFKDSCFIETKNLDGETNLKIKNTHKDMAYYQDMEDNAVKIIFYFY